MDKKFLYILLGAIFTIGRGYSFSISQDKENNPIFICLLMTCGQLLAITVKLIIDMQFKKKKQTAQLVAVVAVCFKFNKCFLPLFGLYFCGCHARFVVNVYQIVKYYF